jgi:hypothetical protein
MDYRKFMVKNFVGLGGVKLATMGKDGKFKPARTISWLKAGPRIFLVFLLYGILKLITGVFLTIWEIPMLALVAFCLYAGFIYAQKYPLEEWEKNDVEKNL